MHSICSCIVILLLDLEYRADGPMARTKYITRARVPVVQNLAWNVVTPDLTVSVIVAECDEAEVLHGGNLEEMGIHVGTNASRLHLALLVLGQLPGFVLNPHVGLPRQDTSTFLACRTRCIKKSSSRASTIRRGWGKNWQQALLIACLRCGRGATRAKKRLAFGWVNPVTFCELAVSFLD